MLSKTSVKVSLAALLALGSIVTVAFAGHSWGPYHWGRTANPFTVKLGDNVSTVWDAYLAESSLDWSSSTVLDTALVTGRTNPKRCFPTSGRVEVCSNKYGFNGWLGVASIWVNGNHIVRGTVKVNDSYFNTTTYNKPEWRRFVMCQEVGHTFGLDHQDESFSNSNLGSCMDYTSDPNGTLKSQLSNEHPNAHDYEQLDTIYAHLDSLTTVGQVATNNNRRDHNEKADAGEADENEEGGDSFRVDKKIKNSLYERSLGNGERLFTFILWTN